jgi:hypothetical protein
MDEPPYGGVWRKIQMNAQMCSVHPLVVRSMLARAAYKMAVES